MNKVLIKYALELFKEYGSKEVKKVFLFNITEKDLRFLRQNADYKDKLVLVMQREELNSFDLSGFDILEDKAITFSRFSRVKQAILMGLKKNIINKSDRVICVLGASKSAYLDTITVVDVKKSFPQEFPFFPKKLMKHKAFELAMNILDIAVELVNEGREGKAIGTTFIIGDSGNVMRHSHQLIFNPFYGYKKSARHISNVQVLESIKEFSKIDGAFIIDDDGYVISAGRYLDAKSEEAINDKGFGSRHNSAKIMTRMTDSIAIVISESTGKITIYTKGENVFTLEPTKSRIG